MAKLNKAARQAVRRSLMNKGVRSSTRTMVSKAVSLIQRGDLEAAQDAVRQAIITLDKAAQKGVIDRNNAARRKSRLMAKLNAARKSKAA